MIPCFVSVEGNTSFLLDAPLTLVGRHPACEVCLGSSRVSRRHCCLASGNGEVFIRDLGSTNGTWINGRRIGVGELRPGDILGVAHLRFRLIFLDRAKGAVPQEVQDDKGAVSQP
jgi:pSer/pThr/pTyr-binding forkhead associated (FHA) protein